MTDALTRAQSALWRAMETRSTGYASGLLLDEASGWLLLAGYDDLAERVVRALFANNPMVIDRLWQEVRELAGEME